MALPSLPTAPGLAKTCGYVGRTSTPDGSHVAERTCLQDHVLIGPSYEVNVATHSRLGVPATLKAAEEEYNKAPAGILRNPAAEFLGVLDSQSCHRDYRR